MAACATSTPPAELGYASGSLGYAAIVSGDLQTAEAQLKSGAAQQNDPARLLNLAHVYRSTGRDLQAASLYRQVLDGQTDPLLALKSGEPARAKELAALGLEQLETSLASRVGN